MCTRRLMRINCTGAGPWPRGGGQFSLGGAQAKTSLYQIKNSWGVPQRRTPTRHTFNTETDRISHIATNVLRGVIQLIENDCLQLQKLTEFTDWLSRRDLSGIPCKGWTQSEPFTAMVCLFEAVSFLLPLTVLEI